jgi:predicted transcriptional regulator
VSRGHGERQRVIISLLQDQYGGLPVTTIAAQAATSVRNTRRAVAALVRDGTLVEIRTGKYLHYSLPGLEEPRPPVYDLGILPF